MGVSIESGPNVIAGFQNPQQNDNPEAGPSPVFAGSSLLDPRFELSIGQAPNYGKVFSLYSNPQTTLIDAFPQAPNNSALASITGGTVIAAPGAGGTNVPLTLTSNPLGFSINVPVCPWTTTRNTTNPTGDGKVAGYGLSSSPPAFALANVVNCTALDFGAAIFTLPATGTTTPTTLSNNTTSPGAVVPGTQSAQAFPANQILTVLAQSTTNWGNPLKFYLPGTYVIVPGAGNAGGTTCLIAQILALDYVNGYMVLNTPVLNTAANNTGVGVGTADPFGVAAWPWQRLGAIASMDPAQTIARTITVTTSSAGDANIVMTIQGYDIWGQPMTEQITTASSAAQAGVKAWKYIQSITASKAGGVTTTNAITFGTGLTTTGAFGFPVRIDQFEYLSLFVNGAYVTANTGFTAALAPTTNPATYTSADVRGTYKMQTAPSGAVHLALYANIPTYQAAGANLLNYAQLFGLTQT
jgi:hypothetical protein